MFVLDKERFLEQLEAKGFSTIQELATCIGVHRNTIHYFLSNHSVFPESIDKMLETLELKPEEILLEKKTDTTSNLEQIAPVVDQLHTSFPQVTFVLFGSRASRKARAYSDWDIGGFSRTGLPHATYLVLLRCKAEYEEKLPFFIDLVNLNQADPAFLKNAAKSWRLLSGQQQDWIELNRRAKS